MLGPGCPKCDETYKIVLQAMAEGNVPVTVEKVVDFAQIARMGVFSTPAVVVDGQIKIAGRVPSKKDVLDWIGA